MGLNSAKVSRDVGALNKRTVEKSKNNKRVAELFDTVLFGLIDEAIDYDTVQGSYYYDYVLHSTTRKDWKSITITGELEDSFPLLHEDLTFDAYEYAEIITACLNPKILYSANKTIVQPQVAFDLLSLFNTVSNGDRDVFMSLVRQHNDLPHIIVNTFDELNLSTRSMFCWDEVSRDYLQQLFLDNYDKNVSISLWANVFVNNIREVFKNQPPTQPYHTSKYIDYHELCVTKVVEFIGIVKSQHNKPLEAT